MPTLSQKAIQLAWDTGHFWSFPNDVTQDKLHILKPDDPTVVQALISMSKANTTVYTNATLELHGRQPDFDGIIGPAMIDLVNTTRCMVPDYAPPEGAAFTFSDPYIQQVCERMQETEAAIGTGNWKSCHNIGNFHCATIGIDDSNLPSFLRPVWLQVLRNVRQSYAGVGLLWKYISKDGIDVLTGEQFSGVINTQLSFSTRSSGWIGLAIVGVNETCGSKIWCRFLSTYKGGSDTTSIATQWTTLVKHELGHNCGRSHTNGGVMNPSIINNLPISWDSDPSASWLRLQFGGVPVPIPGDKKPAPNPLPEPKTVEQRLLDMEVKNIVQDVTIDWSVRELRILKEQLQILKERL